MEWLAVNMNSVAQAIFSSLSFGATGKKILEQLPNLEPLGVTRRMTIVGQVVASVVGTPDHKIIHLLRAHQSDIARQWAAYAVNSFPDLNLMERLVLTQRYAADRNMSVRECAWMAFRPSLALQLNDGLQALEDLVVDKNPFLRRFAVEVTRPRSVWGKHLELLKDEPQRAYQLLHPLRREDHRYVQNAVGNWLNDAYKSQPKWVLKICIRWGKKDHAGTTYMIRRALRNHQKHVKAEPH